VAKIQREDLMYLKELIEAGRLRPVIDRTWPLEEGREAVRYALSGQCRAKVVLVVCRASSAVGPVPIRPARCGTEPPRSKATRQLQ
jgi:hypothetical protein